MGVLLSFFLLMPNSCHRRSHLSTVLQEREMRFIHSAVFPWKEQKGMEAKGGTYARPESTGRNDTVTTSDGGKPCNGPKHSWAQMRHLEFRWISEAPLNFPTKKQSSGKNFGTLLLSSWATKMPILTANLGLAGSSSITLFTLSQLFTSDATSAASTAHHNGGFPKICLKYAISKRPFCFRSVVKASVSVSGDAWTKDGKEEADNGAPYLDAAKQARVRVSCLTILLFPLPCLNE